MYLVTAIYFVVITRYLPRDYTHSNIFTSESYLAEFIIFFLKGSYIVRLD